MPHKQFSLSELRRQQRKLLLWPIILAILFGITGFGELLEDSARIARNKLHPDKASGDIVLVRISDEATRKVGSWPWPRSVQAELIRKAKAKGAERIYLDILYPGTSAPACSTTRCRR